RHFWLSRPVRLFISDPRGGVSFRIEHRLHGDASAESHPPCRRRRCRAGWTTPQRARLEILRGILRAAEPRKSALAVFLLRAFLRAVHLRIRALCPAPLHLRRTSVRRE